LTCAGLALILLANRVSAQPQSSTASLKGTCGLTAAVSDVTSSDPHFLPKPVVAILTFDGVGGVVLRGSQNSAGNVMTLSESGPYSVNPDGVTGTIDLSGSGGPVISFVIVGASGVAGTGELRFINTGKPNPVSGLLEAVVAGVCDF